MPYELEAIGYVRGGRSQATDDDWGSSRARIVLDDSRFIADALAGLADFSHAEIVGVEGLTIEVEGLDAIDGTPILDVKPVLKGFLPRGEVREPAWASEIMKQYW